MTYTVAVLLPGTTGTQLLDENNTVVWPNAVCSGTSADPLALLEDQNLVPGTPNGWDNPSKGYGKFAAYFKSLGFQIATANASNPKPPASLTGNLLIGFGYDWRQDNLKSAQALQSLLNNIDRAYGDYQLYLIGHSMGGLVSRAYLETSLANPAVVQKIRGLITLGTPHLGAPLAMTGIMGRLPDALFVLANCKALETIVPDFINNSWSDSTYELLPPNLPSAYPHTAFLSASMKGPKYSIFDPKLPDKERQAITGLNPKNLERANTFFGNLNYSPTTSSALPPYFCLAGTDQLTCDHFVYALGRWTGVELAAGDMVVPTWSALFTGRPVPATTRKVPLVDHLALPGNAKVQQQVAQWMGINAD